MRNAEENREYMRTYYQQNKHRWKKRSPEKQAEYNERRRSKYSECSETRDKARSKVKEWQSANPRKRLNQRMRKYGLTIEQYESMLRQQHGGCAICGQQPKGGSGSASRLHVDHCHKTGLVRGLLCGNCNHGIGKFKDSVELIEAAAMYLRRGEATGENSDQ